MTEQKFIKKIKSRIVLSVFIILIGVSIFFLPQDTMSNFVSGYRNGVIGGLLGAGLATIVKNIMLLKNKDARQKKFIKQTDERNILISKKALGISWFVTLLLLGISALFTSDEAALLLISIMGISVFIYAITYWVFQKRM